MNCSRLGCSGIMELDDSLGWEDESFKVQVYQCPICENFIEFGTSKHNLSVRDYENPNKKDCIKMGCTGKMDREETLDWEDELFKCIYYQCANCESFKSFGTKKKGEMI